MRNLKPSLEDILFAVTLLVGLGVSWGVCKTRIDYLQDQINEVQPVVKDVASLKATTELIAKNVDFLVKIHLRANAFQPSRPALASPLQSPHQSVE